ncbi:MAG TPA: thioredoxin domain-containing protein [Steroidobacteraceae bacterium]
MRSTLAATILLVGIASLAACSRGEPPAPTSSAPPAAAAEQPPSAAEPAPAALTPEQTARLVRPHSPVLGAAKARVTVVEVLDPACEACRAFAPVVEQLLFLYPDDVRVVVRFADFHPVSLQAIRLLEAAHQQGKFHVLLSALYDRQQEWASHSAPDPARAWKIAGDVGIDIARARKDALAAKVDDMLRLEAEDLAELKVERTPTFFVNGKPLPSFGDKQLLDLVASEVQNR